VNSALSASVGADTGRHALDFSEGFSAFRGVAVRRLS
jgi:hypothetical protein